MGYPNRLIFNFALGDLATLLLGMLGDAARKLCSVLTGSLSSAFSRRENVAYDGTDSEREFLCRTAEIAP
jgi:hypothetical protein